MNDEKINVRENIALLDKVIFYGIKILRFEDIENLIQREIIEISSSKIKYITLDGQEFTRLVIDHDGVVDKMVAGSKWIDKKRVDYCTLETTIKSEVGNLNCYSVDDYANKLKEIQSHLKNVYGIITDFSETKVKEVEINRTFKLEDDFANYYRPLNLLMTNLPSSLKKQNNFREITENNIDYQTFYASSKMTNTSKRYLSFKIYNKTKQLEPIQKIREPYMRVEFRLVGAEKVKKALKTNKFSEMTDELINNYFDEQIDKMIIKPFDRWQKDRDKYIVKLMKTQRQLDLYHWQSNVLRILADEEIATKKPILLDVEELISLVNKLKLKSNRTCDIKANFRKQAKKFEKSFCNNDHAKMTEIIDKLTAKDFV